MSMIFILAGGTLIESFIDGVNAIRTRHYNRTHNKRKFTKPCVSR